MGAPSCDTPPRGHQKFANRDSTAIDQPSGLIVVLALKRARRLLKDRRCQARLENHATMKISLEPRQGRCPDRAGIFNKRCRIEHSVAAEKAGIFKVGPEDFRPLYGPSNEVNRGFGICVADDHDKCGFTKLVIDLEYLGVVFDGDPSQINPTSTTDDCAVMDALVLKNGIKSLIWQCGKE